jgi:hypothetical protein
MRKLPFLLALLLLSLLLLAAAASAHALSLTAPPAVAGVLSQTKDEEADEDGEGEGEEAEVSEADEEVEGCDAEEDEACEEEGEGSEGEGCVLQGAVASMSLAPNVDQLRLTVHYRASEPSVVVLASRLRGAKGGLHLGTDRARFNRRGTYRDSFQLAPKQMPKALAARELEVDVHALGTPAACALQLATRAPHRAR